ncbi:hypothetical protein BG003_011453 [Podila horticola]|nr:hypothetical protein BG003_011453 [Podila horticola]
MAAHNMCNIVLEHLLHQRRPLYPQPRRKDGTYPWIDKLASLGNTATNDTLTSNDDSTAATGLSNSAGAGSSQKRKGKGQAKSQSKKPTLALHSTAPLHAETASQQEPEPLAVWTSPRRILHPDPSNHMQVVSNRQPRIAPSTRPSLMMALSSRSPELPSELPSYQKGPHSNGRYHGQEQQQLHQHLSEQECQARPGRSVHYHMCTFQGGQGEGWRIPPQA